MKKITKSTAGQKVIALKKERASRRRSVKAMEEPIAEAEAEFDEAEEEEVTEDDFQEEEDAAEDAPAEDFMEGEEDSAAEEAEEAVEDLEEAAEDLEEAAEAAGELAEDATDEAEDAEEDAEMSAAMHEADGQMTEAPKPDLGEEDFGASIPSEIADAVAKGAEEMDSSNEAALNVMIPPGLEEAVMAVADPDALVGENVRYEMLPFCSASTQAELLAIGAHWMLTANGQPLAEIKLHDQDNASQIAAHFVTDDFARSVIASLSENGLEKTLSFVKAKVYVAKVDTHSRIKKAKAELEASAAADLRTARADLKASFMDSMDKVLQASVNNIFVENELKDALIAGIRQCGINEGTAAEIVDAAYVSKGKATIKALLDQAEEWSNLTSESKVELDKMLNASVQRSRALPSTRGAAVANPSYDADAARRLEASAKPISQSTQSLTASTEVAASVDSGEDFRAKLKRTFKFNTN